VAKECRGENYLTLSDRADKLDIEIKYISCGQKLSFSGLEFLCINPQKNMVTNGANAYSTVLYMERDSFSALITGDVEEEGQEHVIRDIRANRDMFNNLDLLKVAHHGSMYTTDEEFLRLTKPKLAVISCGRNNKYGHPHKELLQRLEDVGAKIYRTDESGAITISVRRRKISISKCISATNK
jgi:competence protein ComEC